MIAQLYLIAPPDADAKSFPQLLASILARTYVAALLLPRGNRGDADYRKLVTGALAIGQAAGCAVLIEGTPALVRTLGADGLHVGDDLESVPAAVAALKPDLIVGVGGVANRDDAMTAGELGVDYIMFGPFSGAIAPGVRELAGWWAETMEIPSVLSDPEATAETADANGCEFLALSGSVWGAGDPVAMIAAIADRLEQH
jgi:thiamine-phosphate pyrophosphorylase